MTSRPMALSFTFSIKDLTTLKLTSASRRARRTSLSPSSRSFSVSIPLPLNFFRTASNLDVRLSNIFQCAITDFANYIKPYEFRELQVSCQELNHHLPARPPRNCPRIDMARVYGITLYVSPSITLISMIGTIGRCIHNNHPIEYLRSLERSIPKGKFSIKATPPIRSNARLIIIVLNKIIYFMAKSQAKAKECSNSR